MLTTVVKPGMGVVDDEMVFVEVNVDENEKVSSDLKTIKIMQNVANAIDENI